MNTPESRIFDNEDFGYRLVTVERPLRLTMRITAERISRLKSEINDEAMHMLVDAFYSLFGGKPQKDFNEVMVRFENHIASIVHSPNE